MTRRSETSALIRVGIFVLLSAVAGLAHWAGLWTIGNGQ